jgi:hypothetical protein
MQFRTSFNLSSSKSKISYQSRLVAIGSCFSTMIGHRLGERKFKVLNNPFGTIFNPMSLLQLLQASLLDQPADESLLVEHDQRYYHYHVHSDLCSSQRDRLLAKISEQHLLTQKFLSKASHIFITFGTAFVYELEATGQLVANCHKQPQNLFNKRLLSLEEMMTSFREFYTALQAINPSAEIIVTVSPVRHIKDGIPENQLSKSLLRVLCHKMAQECPQVSYFPSYELMMDDLRDYRYYKDDLIHPTAFAENYIWELFKKAYFDYEAVEMIKKIDGILNDLKHKPFHPESTSHRQFLQKLLQKMERMAPAFDFSKEINAVKIQLNPELHKTASHDQESQ